MGGMGDSFWIVRSCPPYNNLIHGIKNGVYKIKLSVPTKGVVFTTLGSGEPHVNVDIIEEDIYIDARGIHDWTLLNRLLLLLNALSFQETNSNVYVYMPYFPGSRQCYAQDGRSPLTVQLVAALLSGATQHQDDRFTFYTFDMYSKQGLKFAREYIDLTTVPVSMNNPDAFDKGIEGIIAPNENASERARLFRNELFEDAAFVQCDEYMKDGLVHYAVVEGDLDPTIGKWLVVDGIYDNDTNFNRLADTVLRQTQVPVQLYASHWLKNNLHTMKEWDHGLSIRYDKFYTPPTLSIVEESLVGKTFRLGNVMTQFVDLPKPVFV